MIRPTRAGHAWFVMLAPCTTDVLRHLLDPDVPWIWIAGHLPDERVRWWPATVPLAPNVYGDAVEVRTLGYDLLLETRRFLELAPAFARSGITLTQLDRRVPDTLTLGALSEAAREAVLVQNGMRARFDLPHAMECAQFTCVDRAHLERVCASPEIAPLLLAPGA